MSKSLALSGNNAYQKALAAGMKMGLDLGISKDDITAIAVSREELSLKRIIRDLESQLAEKGQVVDAKMKAREQAVNDFVQAKFDLAPLLDALKANGFNVKATATGSMQNDKQIVVTVSIADKKDSYRGLERTAEYPIPANIVAIGDEIDLLQNEISGLQDQVIDARCNLGDLGSLERQARATFAESALKGTAEGRDILKMLDELRPTRPEIVGEVDSAPAKGKRKKV